MADKIATPKNTRAIIEKYKFSVRKNYGQNFLIDSNILDKIIEAAEISKEDFVIEIGPGIGSLTQALAENAGQVLAIEIDKKLLPVLKETLAEYDNIEIINADVLKVDVRKLIEEKAHKPVKIAANLPYYITTPILMGLLEQRLPIESITVMVQKEVAERMAAKPKTKAYGALTLAAQYYADIRVITEAPPSCFMPKPKVTSAAVYLRILKEPPVCVQSEEILFDMIKSIFGQRRKTLLNSLYNQGRIPLAKEEIAKAIQSVGLPEKVRGEELSLEQMAGLSDVLYELSAV